ncbi:MAG: hypothetical protein PHV00_06010 [Syntrophales bacterium]|nr:hypothetical protein [Syntrophales bacterium]
MAHTRKSLIAGTLIATALIAWACAFCLGCADTATDAARAFNDSQAWYASLPETTDRLDRIVVVRIRAFGSPDDKQRAWAAAHPQFGPVPAGVCVSSEVPEIWVDLRRAGGHLVLPPHILGHEMMHAAALYDRRLVNPDRLIDPKLYAGG